jgi:siroheme synthase
MIDCLVGGRRIRAGDVVVVDNAIDEGMLRHARRDAHRLHDEGRCVKHAVSRVMLVCTHHPAWIMDIGKRITRIRRITARAPATPDA